MSNLLDKASIILTPTAYNNGKALCVKPSDGSGDFDFSRNSAATRVNAQGLVENVQILSSNLVQNGDFSEEGVQEVSNGSFSQEGVQQITNGNFDTDSDWNLGSGINISGGSVNFTGIPNANINQNAGLTTGKTYKIVFTISNYVSGNIDYNVGGATRRGEVSGNGTYTDYVVSNTGQLLYFQSDQILGFTGSIDNCSVREVGQDWTLGSGWSIAEDKAVAVSGASSRLEQSISGLSGKTCKVSFTLSDYGGSGSVYVDFGSVNSDLINTNGIHIVYGTFDQDEFELFKGAAFSGSITNISVKEVLQDWTAISSSALSIDNGALKISNVTQGYGKAGQSFSTISGKTYKIKFDGFVGTAAQFQYRLGTTEANTDIKIQAYSTNQTIEAQFIALSSLTYLTFVTQSAATGVYTNIDNVSVIEITDDTNLPRINYEGFSYQDALGSEEIVNGDFSNGTNDWSFTSGATLTALGAKITHTPTAGSIAQPNALTIGKQYKLTYEITENISGGLKFNSAIDTALVTSVGVHTKYFEADGTTAIIGRTSSSNNDVTIDNVSVKEYLGQEVVPDSGCGSWLFESQSTNLITQSELFSNAVWTKSGTTVTSGFLSPDGTTNAYKITENTANSVHKLQIINGVSNSFQSQSIFVKYDNSQQFIQTTSSRSISNYVNFDISNKTFTNFGTSVGSIIELNNGWLRLDVYHDSSTTVYWHFITSLTAAWSESYLGTAKYLLIWGAQVEALSYATSYIPTEGSTVTRNQDLCTNGGSLASINSSEGVLYAEIAALANDGTIRYLGLSDGSSNNRVVLLYHNSNNNIRAIISSGGTKFVDVNSSVTSFLDFHKVAIKYKANDFAFWIDGVEVATDTSLNAPIGLNSLDFLLSGGGNFFGKTKALAVWKEALSDSELQSLTTI